jgi:hypothetical protein
MRKKKLPLNLLMIRGAVGKSFVIKHYKFGTFMTKFPDMTKIVASKKQRARRDLFAEAVAWAKTVIADKTKKEEWQKRLKRTKRVYHAAIKEFMLTENKKLRLSEQAQSTNKEIAAREANKPKIPLTGKRNPIFQFFAPVIPTSQYEKKLSLFNTG